jgi:hypothetical protein
MENTKTQLSEALELLDSIFEPTPPTTPTPTREDVEKLKADWLSDPCWDIEYTEGFDMYFEELRLFSEVRRLNRDLETLQSEIERANNLNCSIQLVRYLNSLERKINHRRPQHQ